MAQLVKTTINLPDSLIKAAKIVAIEQRTSVSKLIATALSEKIGLKRNSPNVADPIDLLGKYSLGVKQLYKKRSDLYENTD